MPQGNRKHMQTIDKVLSARTVAQRSSPKVNLTEACSEVVKNKGAGGVDGMSVKELKSYLDNNREELCNTIREGRYIPQPIRGKAIPKRNDRAYALYAMPMTLVFTAKPKAKQGRKATRFTFY